MPFLTTSGTNFTVDTLPILGMSLEYQWQLYRGDKWSSYIRGEYGILNSGKASQVEVDTGSFARLGLENRVHFQEWSLAVEVEGRKTWQDTLYLESSNTDIKTSFGFIYNY